MRRAAMCCVVLLSLMTAVAAWADRGPLAGSTATHQVQRAAAARPSGRSGSPQSATARDRGTRQAERYLGRTAGGPTSSRSATSAVAKINTPLKDPVLVGDTGVLSAADQNASGTAEAFSYTAVVTGAVTDGELYVVGGSRATTISLGLYADNGDKPGALLSSGSLSSPKSSSWNDVPMSAATVTSGDTYWIAVEGTGGYLNYRDTNNGAAAYDSGSTPVVEMPAMYPVGDEWHSGPASAYINGTAAAVAALTAAFTFSPGSPTTGQQVTFDASGSTCAATPCTYSWADVGSSGTSDYPLGTGKQLKFTFQGAGTKYVQLIVTDSAGRTATIEHDVLVTAPLTNLVPPSNTAPPTITGTDTQGATLTATEGTWTGDTPMTFSCKWSDGTSGCTDTLSAADVGQKVSVTVTATNNAGSASATSGSVGPVTAAPEPPANIALPAIAGGTQVGDTLSVSDGSWSGHTPMQFSVTWSDGTTGPDDTLTSADVGKNITATVTASNDAGSASATSAAVGPITASSPPPPTLPGCSTTLSPGANIGTTLSNATSGSTICLNQGTYSGFSISGDNFSQNTTVQSADGTRDVTIDTGIAIEDSSNITLQGLDIEGGGIGGDGGVAFVGTSGSNYTLNNDTIANSDYGVIIGSSSGAVSNVTISNSTLHNFDYSGSSAGTGGGQAVSCYWCSGYTHVNHDIFYAASWHYIQCGGCDNFVVDHNLFSCPCNQHSGAHLNVFQIWQGGSNDAFTNNIVYGNPGTGSGSGEICGGCVLFENGPGGGTASDQFTNYDVSNNLFVNSGGSLPIQVQTTTGGTVSNNTVADGFQYGIGIGYNGVTGVESTGLISQYNIVAGQSGNGTAYAYGCTGSGCVSDYNATDSHEGASGTGSINGWTEDWITTTWTNPLTAPMPAGFYKPADLASTYGYQGSIGP